MLTYTKDKNNEDILLDSNNEQVMMEWEKPYMEACIDKLQPKGDVLEIWDILQPKYKNIILKVIQL